MKTIWKVVKITDEVYSKLIDMAKSTTDTPDSVLRRLFDLPERKNRERIFKSRSTKKRQ